MASKALQWLAEHRDHQADGCLPWPYSRSRGHAQVAINRKVKKASRIMCEWVNGPPPTPKHECAHSCGRGHEGCVNPRHLSWKTRTENQRDRKAHGTAGRGAVYGPKWKLTPVQVSEIRAIGNGETKEELGRRYNVTPSCIARILKRKTWVVDGEYAKVGFQITRGRRARKDGELTEGAK